MRRPLYVCLSVLTIFILLLVITQMRSRETNLNAQPEFEDWDGESIAMEVENKARVPDYFTKLRLRQEIDAYRAAMNEYPLGYDPPEVAAKYYDILGPEIMFEVLEETPYCHAKAHNLGRTIYIKSGRDLAKALQIAGNHCTVAAVHGIIMQIIQDAGGEPSHDNVNLESFSSLATSLCKSDQMKKYIGELSCVHAIGHVLMYLSENDIPRGLKACDIFPSKRERYYCAMGVYMQREKTIGQEDATVSTRFPCDQGYGYPSACYRYKHRVIFGYTNWQGAREVCTELPGGEERNGCFHGLGFTFFGVVIKKPELLPTICESSDKLDRRLCTEGVVGAVLLNAGDTVTSRVCDAQESEIKKWCEDVRKAKISNVDFDLYYIR